MRLLIVGTLKGELITAAKMARDRGAQVAQVDGVDSALGHMRAGRGADLLMVDVSLDIRRLYDAMESERIVTPIVACGTGTDARAAVAAIRAGAKEYIPLPPDAELIAAVLEAVSREKSDFVFRDPSMERVVKLALQVAGSEASVLIVGESGVGKEVMARFLQQKSKRKHQPFVSVNCAAIPENLLESELFGHEKGAFTGALARRIGRFEEANGGTLLLDEISEMDVRLQAKLLRAIQERVIDRVGGSTPVKVDIRILATSNRNLAEAVRQGTFREDLLYRLNVVTLKIPPLRDRPADILALAAHFADKYAELNGLARRPLSEAARKALVANHWKGNVRELENTVHRAVLLATESEIGPECLVPADGDDAPAASGPASRAVEAAEIVTRSLVGQTVAQVEQELILSTLDHCLGNRTHAARILGISIRTLRNKLNEYDAQGIVVPDPGQARTATAA